MNVIDDNFNDHFMEDDEAREQQAVHQETPQEKEDREIEESTISRRHNRMRKAIFAAVAIVIVALFSWVWLRYYHPYAQRFEKGWIMDVSNEGTIFKTLECKVITQDLILDTVKVKWTADTAIVDACNLAISLDNDSLAMEAVKWKGTGKRVLIIYDEYDGTLPWRGATTRVATSIALDTIN